MALLNPPEESSTFPFILDSVLPLISDEDEVFVPGDSFSSFSDLLLAGPIAIEENKGVDDLSAEKAVPSYVGPLPPFTAGVYKTFKRHHPVTPIASKLLYFHLPSSPRPLSFPWIVSPFCSLVEQIRCPIPRMKRPDYSRVIIPPYRKIIYKEAIYPMVWRLRQFSEHRESEKEVSSLTMNDE
jgi:hypothetical protein